jgi:hypothetical protein
MPDNKIQVPSGGSAIASLSANGFRLGVGAAAYGPTSSTGYWNTITVPTGGYVVYINKGSSYAAKGPAVYSLSTDTALINLTKNLSGTNITTLQGALQWYVDSGNNTATCVNAQYPVIPTDSLIACFDAGFTMSFPQTGTAWKGLRESPVINATLSGAVSSGSGQSCGVSFDGTDDYATVDSFNVDFSSGVTIFTFCVVDTTKTWSRIIDFAQGDADNNITLGNYSNTTDFFVEVRGESSATQRIVKSTGGQFAPGSAVKCIAATIEGGTPGANTTAKLYVNGADIATGTVGSSIIVPETVTRASNYIGRSNTGTDAYFDGAVKLLLVYNRELSGAEITALYNAYAGRYTSDVAPNPTPNWGTVGYNDIISQWQYSEQQIQGIDTTITLRVNYNDTATGALWYIVGNSPASVSNISPPADQGFTFIADGGTFTVSSNQYVCFGGDYSSFGPSTNTVTVLNQSDGDVTLDTFTLRIDV